jgi:hypothetical protein
MNWLKVGQWLLIIGLALLQASLTNINWLLLVAIWLGMKEDWLGLWLAGLILDLVVGAELGLSSLKFLLVGGGAWWLWQNWPLKRHKQLKLRWD